MPRLNADQRHKRDENVYQMWLAGVSLRSIGKRVGLSCRGVEIALERRLGEIADEAETKSDITNLRLENLLRSVWTKALAGDLKATEQARCILVAQAKLTGDIASPRMSTQHKLDTRYGDADLRESGDDNGNVSAGSLPRAAMQGRNRLHPGLE